jgi:hypothetical protein
MTKITLEVLYRNIYEQIIYKSNRLYWLGYIYYEIYLHNRCNIIILTTNKTAWLDLSGVIVEVPLHKLEIKKNYTKIGEFEE